MPLMTLFTVQHHKNNYEEDDNDYVYVVSKEEKRVNYIPFENVKELSYSFQLSEVPPTPPPESPPPASTLFRSLRSSSLVTPSPPPPSPSLPPPPLPSYSALPITDAHLHEAHALLSFFQPPSSPNPESSLIPCRKSIKLALQHLSSTTTTDSTPFPGADIVKYLLKRSLQRSMTRAAHVTLVIRASDIIAHVIKCSSKRVEGGGGGGGGVFPYTGWEEALAACITEAERVGKVLRKSYIGNMGKQREIVLFLKDPRWRAVLEGDMEEVVKGLAKRVVGENKEEVEEVEMLWEKVVVEVLRENERMKKNEKRRVSKVRRSSMWRVEWGARIA